MRPESRKTQLLAQEVGDEIVIYDERTHEAHHLSPTAAVVWRAADGERSLPELSSLLRESIAASRSPTPLGDEDGDGLVRLALDELNRVGLLVRGLPGIGDSMTRREMLGVTAALLPVIASVVAPTPAMAQTTVPPPPPPGGHPANGTYDGQGRVNGANPCNFGNGAIRVVLNLNAAGTGTLRVVHIPANQTFFFTNAVAQQASANTWTVRATSTGAGFTISNLIHFTVFPELTDLSGEQTFSGECGTFRYGLTAQRTSLSTA